MTLVRVAVPRLGSSNRFGQSIWFLPKATVTTASDIRLQTIWCLVSSPFCAFKTSTSTAHLVSSISTDFVRFTSRFHCHRSINQSTLPTTKTKMCYQIVERYAVCRCLYHKHSVDPCQRYGQRGHSTTEKTVLVGFACPSHQAKRRPDQTSSSDNKPQGGRPWHDSGYSSGGSTRR